MLDAASEVGAVDGAMDTAAGIALSEVGAGAGGEALASGLWRPR